MSNESCATLQPIHTCKTIFCVKILCKPPVFISLPVLEGCASARKWVSNTFKCEEMGVELRVSTRKWVSDCAKCEEMGVRNAPSARKWV